VENAAWQGHAVDRGLGGIVAGYSVITHSGSQMERKAERGGRRIVRSYGFAVERRRVRS